MGIAFCQLASSFINLNILSVMQLNMHANNYMFKLV